MKKNVIYLGLAVLLCIGIIYSCSKNSAPAPVKPAVANADAQIQNFAFSPATINIKAGTTVTWKNMDSAPHTVTALTGAFDSGSIATNSTFKFQFNTPGTYVYHCTIHSMMANATVIVSSN